jgi:prepilin-type N-terminal cleavage/methylation domain
MTENLTMKVKKKKGFTLIELIIVVAIIAILAALAIPKLMGTQENAKKKTDIANAKMIYDTVSKLMTEDTIPTSNDKFIVTSGNASSTTEGKVYSELQTNPEPKYDNTGATKKHFIVKISDKNISVYVGTAETDADSSTKEIYPEANAY